MTPLLDKLQAAFLALMPGVPPVVEAAAGLPPAAVTGGSTEGNKGNGVGGSSCPSLASVKVPAPTGTVAAAPSPATTVVGASAVPLPPASPCQIVNAATKGYHLDVKVSPELVVAAAELLDREGFAIDTVTGVDWMAANEMEVAYDFFHPRESLHIVVRTRVPRAKPEVPTISSVFAGANWHERETHEFFGIKFLGHPNLTPLLLPEDATYHPLRKDFVHA